MIVVENISCNNESTTTRIETAVINCELSPDMSVAIMNPLQQGLKHVTR